MPTDPRYKYDVFISYKSEDRPWAAKLYNDLQAKGLEPFIDYGRLEVGKKWEPQLATALRDSQHLVVVWSAEADRSSWVRKEIAHFEARIDAPIPGEKAGAPRIIFVLLQEEDPAAYSDFQMIRDLQAAGVYDAGIDELGSNLWLEVVERVKEAVQSDDTSKPVLLAIVAMTLHRLNSINPTLPLPGGFMSLNALLSALSIPTLSTRADLESFYGPHPRDWRPFGSTRSIWTMMNTLKDEITPLIPDTPFRWELVGDDLWSNDFQAAKREADRLASDWSVIVVDPLSFYDQDIRQCLNSQLYRALDNPKAVFITLPPFDMLVPYAHFRTLVERMATQVFDRFYNPKFPTRHYAKCNINIVNRLDIKQWLLTTVGSEFAAPRRESQHVALSV